ncbi:unnamed protein product [Dovyalis caffra]|uniref:Gustatory receptor n=1 Tax=Dovyalis caffra TaxID=77055 RepID=A0AAV1RFZ4_9ROSI|nr:unnamed protein product [Dovyalis caffra]
MPRRTAQVLDSFYLISTVHIFKESIRVMLLRPTHFHSISIFLFSPLPISLFISHFLIHASPQLPFSAISITDHLFGQIGGVHPLPQLASKTLTHIIICFPSSITFALLGRAATVQVVSDSYSGINLDGRRLLTRSGSAWIKLLHTTFWELLILLSLWVIFVATLVSVPATLFAYGICSRILGFWVILGFLGVPFCLAFAHLMVLGNLAKVLTVLESECCGFKSLVKANNMMAGRQQTALIMALLSNIGLRLVECLFEFKMSKGISFWEGPMLVSMYSMVLVFDTVTTAVFYYACKP